MNFGVRVYATNPHAAFGVARGSGLYPSKGIMKVVSLVSGDPSRGMVSKF